MTDDRVANYAGAFDGHLTPGRKAVLLIVDVVVAYLDPASPLYAHAEPALASNERLAAAAREHGVPVMFTNVDVGTNGVAAGRFYSKVPSLKAFVTGSPLGAFPPSLQPRADELIITKQYASAFFGTPLASALNASGVDTLFITGFSTSGCVRATALDALQHGFIPFVIADACADRHPGPHDANLFDMQAKMAEVINESDAIALFEKHFAA